MSSDEQQSLRDQERAVADLRKQYEEATGSFTAVRCGRSKRANRIAAFHTWRAAGTAYFNAFDRKVVLGSGCDSAWITDSAETAVDLLEIIRIHYSEVRTFVAAEGMSARPYMPTTTAFAAMQRLVKRVLPEKAAGIRDKYLLAELPVHGFDTLEHRQTSDAYQPALWEKIVLSVASSATLVLIAVLLLRNQPFADPNLVVLLRIVLAVCAGAMAVSIPGFLNLGTDSNGLRVRAGGALAVLAVALFYTPTVLNSATPATPTPVSTR